MSDELYISAEEAAEALGVNVATIYAYVSRKLIRSYKPPGTRVARYWRADIERIRQRTPASVAREQANPLVSETQITVITEAGPFYRGRSAVALAQTATLESVAALLWQVDEATAFPAKVSEPPRALQKLWPVVDGMSAVDKAMACFPIIEGDNPRSYDLTLPGFARTAGEAMRWFAAIMIGAERPSSAPLHEVISVRAKDRAMSDVARHLLVLSADHELDPTTYAVRAVANAGINPYRLIIAGLITSMGRRLAYGRIETQLRFLEELASAAHVKDVVVARLREGETIPGFGSRLYSKGDPRAISLLETLQRQLPGDRDLENLVSVIAVVREITGLEPDFSLLNLFVGRKLGLSQEERVALRLGRMAGWVAHAMEQYFSRDLVRPRALYVGPLPSKSDRIAADRPARGRRPKSPRPA
jgi:citrate synthase